jgi:hypothetical protein
MTIHTANWWMNIVLPLTKVNPHIAMNANQTASRGTFRDGARKRKKFSDLTACHDGAKWFQKIFYLTSLHQRSIFSPGNFD